MSTKFRLLLQHAMLKQPQSYSRYVQERIVRFSTSSVSEPTSSNTSAKELGGSSLFSNNSLLSKQINDMANKGHPERPYTVVVEGNIGSGKTTFLQPFMATSNGKYFDNAITDMVEVIEEPVSRWRNLKGHNLLQLMYEDPKRWSLMFQTYVQLTMIQHHSKPCPKPIRIMERSLARYCFVENLYNGGNMTDAEYTVISEWFNFLITCPQLYFKIDHIVYLRTEPEVAYERIKKRQRPEEHLIPFTYLKDLHELHEDWLMRKTKFQPLPAPVTIIDANADIDILAEKYKLVGEQLLQQATSVHTASN